MVSLGHLVKAFLALVALSLFCYCLMSRHLFSQYMPSSSSVKESSVQVPPLHDAIFHSPEIFRLDYEEMEKTFNIYMYEDSNPCTLIPTWFRFKYRREMFFWQSIRNSQFWTALDNVEHHLFFLPISCVEVDDTVENEEAELYLNDFVYNYPYWNRTLGADHFYMTCNDIRVTATEHAKFLTKNSIRIGCSASYNDSIYIPHKDVAIPHMEVFEFPAGGTDIRNRTKLGFGVGKPESDLTVELLRTWKNDKELDIRSSNEDTCTLGRLYSLQLYSAKYCICPRSYHVDGTCIAVAIHFGCVPVILSNYYDLPFNDILDWNKFSVILMEADVYRLKEILKSIPFSMYKELQENVVKVQRHFQWNWKPIKYDAFHMVLYELWMRHHAIRY